MYPDTDRKLRVNLHLVDLAAIAWISAQRGIRNHRAVSGDRPRRFGCTQDESSEQVGSSIHVEDVSFVRLRKFRPRTRTGRCRFHSTYPKRISLPNSQATLLVHIITTTVLCCLGLLRIGLSRGLGRDGMTELSNPFRISSTCSSAFVRASLRQMENVSLSNQLVSLCARNVTNISSKSIAPGLATGLRLLALRDGASRAGAHGSAWSAAMRARVFHPAVKRD